MSTNFLNYQYLDHLKKQRLEVEPSKTLLEALRQLKSENQKQKQQINLIKTSLSQLANDNQHLNQCIKKMGVDYEQYKSHRNNRENRNTKNQMELLRKIQQLEFDNQRLLIEIESYKAIAELSTSRSQFTTKSFIPEPPTIQRPVLMTQSQLVQPLSRQIEELQFSNQVLTKKILETNSQEATQIRSKMRQNNKQIAKLKSRCNNR